MTRRWSGYGRGRIAVVDEQHVDRRVVVLGERAAEVVHVDDARLRFRCVDPRALDVPRRGVAHGIAAASNPEFSADRGQGENRERGVAAVAVALEAPSALDECRRTPGVERCERFDYGRVHPRHFRRALERPRFGAFPQLVRAAGVLAQERLVRVAVLEEIPMDRERDDNVGAGLDREVHVGAARERRGAGIDDDELGAALLRFAQVRDDVNPRGGRVDAPQDDQPGLRVIPIRDRRHLPVQRHIGCSGWRRAESTSQA